MTPHMADEPDDFNARVVAEFRSNGGVVGGPFEGAPLLLLHHYGARSGTERVTPLMYQEHDSRLFVFASNAGAPQHPAWYHNLRANPLITIEVATADGSIEKREVRAVDLDGDDRVSAWDRQKADVPQFADYETSADRVIPVVELVNR